VCVCVCSRGWALCTEAAIKQVSTSIIHVAYAKLGITETQLPMEEAPSSGVDLGMLEVELVV